MNFKVMSLASSVMLATFSLRGFAEQEKIGKAPKVNGAGKCRDRIQERDYSGLRSKVKCWMLVQWLVRLCQSVPAPQSELDQEGGLSAVEWWFKDVVESQKNRFKGVFSVLGLNDFCGLTASRAR